MILLNVWAEYGFIAKMCKLPVMLISFCLTEMNLKSELFPNIWHMTKKRTKEKFEFKVINQLPTSALLAYQTDNH